MNPIFNTKNRFYDYFPHLPMARMKNDFGLGFFEQTVVRDHIQKDIRLAYNRLVVSHDLVHANVYGEIGEEFDVFFYQELKDTLHRHFREERTWAFLDDLLKQDVIKDDFESQNFNTRMQAALGLGLKRDINGRINLKDAFVALVNHDLDELNGRELLYLTKII